MSESVCSFNCEIDSYNKIHKVFLKSKVEKISQENKEIIPITIQ
jgi:hypothetical protein